MSRFHRFAVLIAFALPQATALAQARWTLGSPSDTVAAIQGKPDLIERYASMRYAVWHFGGSWVRFGFDDHRVIGWSNAGALRVDLKPGADTTAARSFRVGSSRDDVVRLEGTPIALIPRPERGDVQLRYRNATVGVGSRDGRVHGWDDPTGALHTRAAELTANPRPRPAAPASLSAAMTFVDDSDDGQLDADERATITMVVRNSGRGTAYATALAISTSPPGAIVVVSAAQTDSIAPGRIVTLRAVIAGATSLRAGPVTISVGVREANGFDLDPVQKLTVTSRGFRPPKYALDAVGVADQSGNGRIEPREIVDVAARIANRGTGDARDLIATITAGPDVIIAPGSPREIALGTLRAGEVRDVRFTAFTNSRATSFSASVAVRGTPHRADTTIAMTLPLDRPIADIPTLIVRGRDPRAPVSPPPLVIDVDTGVPRAAHRRDVVAVVLGVERYQRVGAAPFAKRDAAVFREYATSLFGVDDSAGNLFFRTDDEVTGSELRKVFGADGWLARRVTARTDVVVYFAGHGVADPKTRAPYILGNDADANYPAQTGFALAELYDRLAALGARSVTVFVDACFSGGTRDGGSLFSGAREVVVSVEHPALRSETMAVFTASSASQLASVSIEKQHGLFSYWLLKGLRGDADDDADKRTSIAELERFLRVHVPADAARIDREQVPQVVARNKSRVLVERR